MTNPTDTSRSHSLLQSTACCATLALVLWGCVEAMLLCADLLRQVGQPVMQSTLGAFGG